MQDQMTARYSGYHRRIFVCLEYNRVIGIGIKDATALRDELNTAIGLFNAGGKGDKKA